MITKYTFSARQIDTNGDALRIHTSSVRADCLIDVIQEIDLFLKGCGFVFPKGVHLGYEEDDNDDCDVLKDL